MKKSNDSQNGLTEEWKLHCRVHGIRRVMRRMNKNDVPQDKRHVWIGDELYGPEEQGEMDSGDSYYSDATGPGCEGCESAGQEDADSRQVSGTTWATGDTSEEVEKEIEHEAPSR